MTHVSNSENEVGGLVILEVLFALLIGAALWRLCLLYDSGDLDIPQILRRAVHRLLRDELLRCKQWWPATPCPKIHSSQRVSRRVLATLADMPLFWSSLRSRRRDCRWSFVSEDYGGNGGIQHPYRVRNDGNRVVQVLIPMKANINGQRPVVSEFGESGKASVATSLPVQASCRPDILRSLSPPLCASCVAINASLRYS